MWRKSSHSMANGNCVEVDYWRKSSYSMSNGNCTEVRTIDGMVFVRDSQDPNGYTMAMSPDTWTRLIRDVRSAV